MHIPSSSDLSVIAPAGVLRLALFPSFFYRRGDDGQPRGVGIEIARALAERAGAALRADEFTSPPKVVAALAAGAADVALLGIDAERGKEVDFSQPVLAADFTFLVPPGAVARELADADRADRRIAVVRHHAMDTALRGQLRAATPVYADTPDAAFELLRSGQANVLAGIRPGLLAYAKVMPGARVLPGRYGRNVIALAVRKDASEGLSAVSRFVREAKEDGTFLRAIDTAGLQGVDIPP
jgi:polar amino acid transport system substrate-binding protein